jgi:hypothetical protein
MKAGGDAVENLCIIRAGTEFQAGLHRKNSFQGVPDVKWAGF